MKIQCFHLKAQGKRKYMEDYVVLVDESDYILSCVFDGHGGKRCAEYLAHNVKKIFAEQFNRFKKRVPYALRQTVNKMQNYILKKQFSSGSTANIVVIDKNKSMLHVLNVGDSRAIYKTKHNRKQVTTDHTPTLEKEFNDITRRGGRVTNGRVQGTLNLSRAFGNFFISEYISSVPDLYTKNIENLEYVVQASDGLFEAFTNSEVCQKIEKKGDPKKIVSDLVNGAIANGSTDNISLILIRISQ